ncbi:hypothetical protein THAOC_04148 [Thalassiosira oceanica]|uniref:F-box domain-containing protein n=1 Tax=Thalassiosira oceanica TaxID=159749 RepID=K0T626_THAOC|nr:hypothetical protein THAOC_04148 [Thalassiosira oceanica]|eukprot:EJK74188.1 hypothetical protein THAOC_04148 [Thalassiosira oceanica]
MADDGRAKRPKPSEDGGAVIAERERIAELESEIAQLQLRSGMLLAAANQEVAKLRGRVVELESENDRLRRRGQAEGNHNVLPVVMTAIVDLSRIDTGVVAQISSFLAASRELLNLALTCKSFGWRQPMSTLNWSLVEEVARQSVCSRATDAEISFLPRYVSGTTTWLSILHIYEHPLLFDVLIGGCIEHLNEDKTTVCATGDDGISSAVASRHVMSSGVHFAEFQITGTPYIGVGEANARSGC